jgi:HEAT repeat protein
MKPSALVLARLLGAFALAASTAFAQGGLFRGAGGLPQPPGGMTGPGGTAPTPQNQGRSTPAERESAPRPGSVPAILFSEERWEFWWEFNHDAYVNLRPSLLNAPSSAAFPKFAPFDADGRGRLLVPALIELLRDRDEVVRSAAVLALARLQDPSVLPYIANAAVGDPSLPVRNNALIALGISRIPKAVERLKLTMFDETSPDESRVFAAVALGINGSPEGSATLRSAFVVGSESALPYTVRLAAIWALGLAGDPGNAPFLRTLVNSKGLDETAHALAIEAIGRVGDRAANATLVAALDSPHSIVRRSAAVVLGVVGRPEDADVVRALEHALDADADQTVRSFAALSLGRIAGIGAPAIVERLRARFKGETARLRAFVALALGISGYQAAGTDLMAAFHDEGSTSLRGAYATALALLDQKEAIPELRAAFRNEKTPDLRGYLAYALGRLGDVEVANDLRQILARDNQPQLLYWSAVALGLLGDRPAQQFLEEQVRRGGADQVTRGSWLHALGSIGDQSAAPFLIETAKSSKETAFMRALATAALGMLADEDRAPLTANFSRDHNYTMSLAFIPELYYLF